MLPEAGGEITAELASVCFFVTIMCRSNRRGMEWHTTSVTWRRSASGADANPPRQKCSSTSRENFRTISFPRWPRSFCPANCGPSAKRNNSENRHRGSGRPLAPATPPGHAGPHPAVQRVTQRQRTGEGDQANRSKQSETRKTGPDCSPNARGRVDCPPFARRGPDRSPDDVTSRTAASHVSTASRSWIAADAVSTHPESSAARVSDSSRSNFSSPFSRLTVPSSFVPD